MCDKVECEFFHETDGDCCASRETCYLGDPKTPRPEPLVEPAGKGLFFVILGIGAVCYLFGFVILNYHEPRSATYLAPLTRMTP